MNAATWATDLHVRWERLGGINASGASDHVTLTKWGARSSATAAVLFAAARDDHELFDVWCREPRGPQVLLAVRWGAGSTDLPGVRGGQSAR
jgi:hypothetical protein